MAKSGNSILGSLIFAIVGIAIMWFGIHMHNENKKFLETALQTEGTITNITYDYDASSEDTDYNVFIKFEVDGNEYKGELGEYNSSMHIGDAVTIYYNPLNPYEFKSNSSNYIGYIIFAFGGIFLTIGIFSIFSGFSTKGNSI